VENIDVIKHSKSREITVEVKLKQQAALYSVTEYFAKSLKVTENGAIRKLG